MATFADYYLGDNNGKMYVYSASYKGDAGQNITTQWVSKRMDFLDQMPELLGKRITVYSVNLIYIDLGNLNITVSVSTDGGVSWIDKTKSIGTGSADGKTRSERFHFTESGQFFNFKVSHTGTSSIFQWLELRPEVDSSGEFFNIN